MFDATLADRIIRSGMHADLVIVSIPTGAFAHQGQLFDTVATVLRPGGVLTLEVPDVLRVVGHPRLRTRLRAESANTVEHPATVAAFVGRASLVRRQIRGLLDYAREQHRTVAVWGTSPDAVALAAAARMGRRVAAYAVDPDGVHGCAVLQGTDIPIMGPADIADRRPDLVLALGDLPVAPHGWEGVPIYAVTDLVEVVHRVTDNPDIHFAR